MNFSLGQSGDMTIAGDWNGDGVDTTGVFRPSTGEFFLKNSNDQGFAEVQFAYGTAGTAYRPIAGDWNSDGIDTIGLFYNGIFYLRNANTTGSADLTLAFGVPTDLPVAGNWDGLPSTLPPTPTPTSTPGSPSPMNASFTYDGDGKRVKSVINSTTTYFVGAHYEVTGSTITKYYFAGAQKIAMRTYSIPQNSTVNYLLSDHLGSTSLTTDANGNLISEMRYKAWGEVRYASGNTPTKYQYTGQFSDSYINLLWYGSRHYDPYLNQFTQPDSIIPDMHNSQDWNRYAYVRNNPLKYTDPTGHCSGDPDDPHNPDNKCWNLIDTLENTYDNVNILNQDRWTYEELYLLRSSIGGHAFSKDILSAKELNFYRNDYYDHRGDGVGGYTNDPLGNGEYDITIYDAAYDIRPSVNSLGGNRQQNFLGTLTHELTHVATGQNPSILESYQQEQTKHFPGTNIGIKYDKGRCKGQPNCMDLEMIAITAAVWQVDRNSFTALTTDWRGSWITSNISISPYVGVCYGPLP